jgi:FtsZ-binding cell division protein ZapB
MEICYDGRDCPACKLQEEIDTLKEKVDKLESDLQDAQRGE